MVLLINVVVCGVQHYSCGIKLNLQCLFISWQCFWIEFMVRNITKMLCCCAYKWQVPWENKWKISGLVHVQGTGSLCSSKNRKCWFISTYLVNTQILYNLIKTKLSGRFISNDHLFSIFLFIPSASVSRGKIPLQGISNLEENNIKTCLTNRSKTSA